MCSRCGRSGTSQSRSTSRCVNPRDRCRRADALGNTRVGVRVLHHTGLRGGVHAHLLAVRLHTCGGLTFQDQTLYCQRFSFSYVFIMRFSLDQFQSTRFAQIQSCPTPDFGMSGNLHVHNFNSLLSGNLSHTLSLI